MSNVHQKVMSLACYFSLLAGHMKKENQCFLASMLSSVKVVLYIFSSIIKRQRALLVSPIVVTQDDRMSYLEIHQFNKPSQVLPCMYMMYLKICVVVIPKEDLAGTSPAQPSLDMTPNIKFNP